MRADTQLRDRKIDALRFLMAAAVVVLHTIPVNVPGRSPVALPMWVPPVDAFCRVAVPFFFIVSGYYVRTGLGLWQTVARPFRRILPIYVLWLVVYVVLARWLAPSSFPLRWTIAYDGGPAFHLWFLPALAVSLAALPLARQWLGWRVTALCVILLALIGPIAFAYLQLFHVPYPWRLTPIVRQLAAPAFVFIGMQLKGRGLWSFPMSVTVAVTGYLVMLGEGVFLSRHAAGYVGHDVVVGTFLLGTGLFQLARSLRAQPWPTDIAYLGQVSLGIYASHVAFVWLMRRSLPDTPFPLVTIVALGGAIVVSLLFARSALLRRFVS